MCLCPCLLPCLGGATWAGYKANKTADRLFSDKKPQEPTEPAFVTEAKLKWNLTNWKPGGSDAAAAAAAAEQAKGPERAKRADRYSSKEQASKQRLAELVDQHKASRNGRGGSSSAGSASRKAPGSQSFRR